jgi:hypothetical protein
MTADERRYCLFVCWVCEHHSPQELEFVVQFIVASALCRLKEDVLESEQGIEIILEFGVGEFEGHCTQHS